MSILTTLNASIRLTCSVDDDQTSANDDEKNVLLMIRQTCAVDYETTCDETNLCFL